MSGENKYTVRYGEDIGNVPELPENFLDRVFELDQAVYEEEYVGCPDNMIDRYNAFKESFVFLMDGDKLAGYICFFPVKDHMWKRITGPDESDIKWTVKTGENGEEIKLEQIPDDDILGKDIVSDIKEGDHLNFFVISTVIAPDYRTPDHTATDAMVSGWIDYLNSIRARRGIVIDSIAGVAVTEGGKSFARSSAFKIIRVCMDAEKESDRSLVYVSDGKRLDRFLEGQFYRKSFRDDIYLMLPFEADETVHEVGGFPKQFDHLSDEEAAEIPAGARYLMRKIKDSRDFECSNEVSREVTEHYLGEFMFLHTLDDYCDEDDPDEEPTIIGEEKAYIILLAHRRTGMYLILMLIPDSRFSTSQILDQCSKNYIKIRRTGPEWEERGGLTKGAFHYAHIDDYLEKEYGLISAGPGKCMTCMTSDIMPQPGEDYVTVGDKRTTREMMNILAGETYYSLFQNFKIYNRELMDMATTDLAAYDYYESYMSDRTIIFKLKKEVLPKMPPDSDFLEIYRALGKPIESGSAEYMLLTRIGLAATMLFIMEMVMFQNTSLAKMTKRVTRALLQAGNVPWEYISRIYEEYGKTIQFWKKDNFKYHGTGIEAKHIRDAFENDDLKSVYGEQQEYLQKVVDLNSAEIERRNSMFIGIVGVVLALFGAQDYVKGVICKFYESLPHNWIADAATEADRTFNVLGIGGFLLAFFLLNMTGRRNFYNRMKRLIKSEDMETKDDI